MPIQKPRNKAYLVILETSHKHKDFLKESHKEMIQLVQSAAIKPLGATLARVQRPSPSHFVRQGKLEEIALEAKKAKANVLIFNVDLTPVQARNIEHGLKIPAVDRTGLILEIFGRRAKSREGKLQVELARLNYTLPRLGGLGGVMSRLGGGIGTRGPGEQELEWDRRKIRRRIQRVKEELVKVGKHRKLLRSNRKKKNFTTIALVGYTNAGKSTLLNALTGSEAYAADKLFATLDSKTRVQTLNGYGKLLFIDTVGFLRDLPHTLVDAFHATLEEVVEADLLIHVLDISNPYAQEYKESVEVVLKEIGASEKTTVLALNKTDLLEGQKLNVVKRFWPNGVCISAQKGKGLEDLMGYITQTACLAKDEVV